MTTTPIMRVDYSGANGRQEKFVWAKGEMETRTLFLPTLAIAMIIKTDPGKLQGDQTLFFDSLELGK